MLIFCLEADIAIKGMHRVNFELVYTKIANGPNMVVLCQIFNVAKMIQVK